LLNFFITRGNIDDRNQNVLNVLSKNLFGKLYGDKGYISSSLFEVLFNDGIHLMAALAAYCFFDKEPSIRFERELPNRQLALFY